MRGVHPRYTQGVRSVTLLGIPQGEVCNTAGYTSGCTLGGDTSAQTVLLSLFPFHCWARKPPPPTTRFTVGQERRAEGHRNPAQRALLHKDEEN